MRVMVRCVCDRMGEEAFKGLIRYMLLTFAQKRSCTRKQCMCVPVPNMSSSFQPSLSAKHTSQITFV